MIDNLELIRLLYVEGSTHGSVMCKLARYAAEVLEKQDKRIAELEAENKKLREELRACADDLEAELRARYGCVKGGPIHPAENRRFQRDMGSVYAARAALKGGEKWPKS